MFSSNQVLEISGDLELPKVLESEFILLLK